jgi:hypothetical protein
VATSGLDEGVWLLLAARGPRASFSGTATRRARRSVQAPSSACSTGTARRAAASSAGPSPASVAPAGLVLDTGDRVRQWRVPLDGDRQDARGHPFAELGERIRDLQQGPDGCVYLLTDGGRLNRVQDRLQVRSGRRRSSFLAARFQVSGDRLVSSGAIA